jgi:hypothetical protein
MSHAPIKTSSEFADLETAVLENLQVRGVISRLRAALEVEVRAALSGPTSAGEASAQTLFREHPDKHLSNALVAEYLLASGCSGALSAFCQEAGVPRPTSLAAGTTLAPPFPSVPLVFNAQNSGARTETTEDDAIGAIARALAERVAEPLLAGSLAAVSAALPEGGEPSARDAVNTWLRTRRGALPETHLLLLPGGLERVVVAAELGLEIEALTVPAVMRRGPVMVSSSSPDVVTIALPLLFALVSAARKTRADGAMAVPGWLAPGAREGLAAAAASVCASVRGVGGVTVNAQPSPSSFQNAQNDNDDAAAFDSDEDIPGVIARVQAANARRDAVATTRAQANLLVRTRLGVGTDSSNIIFAANGGAGVGLLVEGGGDA